MTQTVLTKEQVLKLSNADLDILVAVHVMKLPVHPLTGLLLFREGNVFYLIPEYSTDIALALKVIEEMRNKKIYLDTRIFPDYYQVLPHLDEKNKLVERWITKHPILAEAICKAALLAVLDI